MDFRTFRINPQLTMESQRLALIIDDEPDICYLLGKMLSSRSIVSISANSVQEGLSKLHEFSPVLLFLDIQLPDGSGLDSIPMIRNTFPRITIVIMSAFDGQAEKNTAIQNGADFFLPKPFQQEIIDELVKTSLLRSWNI